MTFAMFIAAIGFSFTACGDDDDEGEKGDSKTSPAKYKVIDTETQEVHNFTFYTGGDFKSSIAEGESQVFYVVCQKSGGDTWYRPKNVTFTSTNESVATVEKTGEGIVTLKAKSAGKTLLKAQLPGSSGDISIQIVVTGKVPKSSEEAVKMFEGYWTWDNMGDEGHPDYLYRVRFSSDGSLWYYYTIRNYTTAPSSEWWVKYAGKTVAYKGATYEVYPDKKDPSKGEMLLRYDDNMSGITFVYRNLCQTGFESIIKETLEEDDEPIWNIYSRSQYSGGVTYIKNPW